MHNEEKKEQINIEKKRPLRGRSQEKIDPIIDGILEQYDVFEKEHGFRVIVPGVNLFTRNSDQLSQNALSILKPIAETAQFDDGLSLTIIGHVDSLKSIEISRELSILRAKLVREFLSESFGISADRMEILGEGKESPIASNSTLDGRQANRRVEILFEKR